MTQYAEYPLANLVAVTASGQGSSFETILQETPELEAACRVFLDVTAVSGTTPTLDVDVIATINGIDFVVSSFTQVVAVGRQSIVIPSCPRTLRAAWVIGGTTPSFDFSVSAVRI